MCPPSGEAKALRQIFQQQAWSNAAGNDPLKKYTEGENLRRTERGLESNDRGPIETTVKMVTVFEISDSIFKQFFQPDLIIVYSISCCLTGFYPSPLLMATAPVAILAAK